MSAGVVIYAALMQKTPLSNQMIAWAIVGVYLSAITGFVVTVCLMMANGKPFPVWMIALGGVLVFTAFPINAAADEFLSRRSRSRREELE